MEGMDRVDMEEHLMGEVPIWVEVMEEDMEDLGVGVGVALEEVVEELSLVGNFIQVYNCKLMSNSKFFT